MAQQKPKASVASTVMLGILLLISVYNSFKNVSGITNCAKDQNQEAVNPPASVTANPLIKSVSAALKSTGSNATSKFDELTQIVYEKAIAPAKIERKPFKLKEDNWERGNGGLDDADRQTLFDLYYNASSVFEWGLGESTKIAAKVGVPRYAGIDSDPVWVQQAREQAGMDHFRFSYADIGATKMWGYAENSTLQKIALNYQVAPLLAEKKPFDVYLADGRYRVACGCIAFLHAIKYGGDMEKIRVGIHDNNDALRKYGDFKEVGDIVIQNQRLWVYKLKPGITEEQLLDLWARNVGTLM